jgi:hypothetical protein
MVKRTIFIGLDGVLHCIYDDAVVPALIDHGGHAETKRASEVEPTVDGQWTADLGRSGGPVLGPFRTRGEALDAETKWLLDRLSQPNGNP